MVTISWPEPQKYPVNLYSVIPGWMIYFNDNEKISMHYLHEQFVLDGVKVVPSPGLLAGRVSKVQSFLSEIMENR
jgi:hypothetical protein